jgi:hypothetical protein
MVNVTDGADVYVWFRSNELFLGHRFLPSESSLPRSR